MSPNLPALAVTSGKIKWKSSLPPPVNMCLTHWEARCASPASVVIWDPAAGIWRFEVTFADPYELSFKAFHLPLSATQKSKSSVLVCLFSGILGHLSSLMHLKISFYHPLRFCLLLTFCSHSSFSAVFWRWDVGLCPSVRVHVCMN